MKTLKLINAIREPIGTITWSEPDIVDCCIGKPAIANAVLAMIEDGRRIGLILRASQPMPTEGGQLVLGTRHDRLKPNEPRFLEALLATITSVRIDGQRIFGIITSTQGDKP